MSKCRTEKRKKEKKKSDSVGLHRSILIRTADSTYCIANGKYLTTTCKWLLIAGKSLSMCIQATYDMMVWRSFAYIIFQLSVQWTYKSCRYKKWIELFAHKHIKQQPTSIDINVYCASIFYIINYSSLMIKFNIVFHDRHLVVYDPNSEYCLGSKYGSTNVWTDWAWSSFSNIVLLYIVHSCIKHSEQHLLFAVIMIESKLRSFQSQCLRFNSDTETHKLNPNQQTNRTQ